MASNSVTLPKLYSSPVVTDLTASGPVTTSGGQTPNIAIPQASATAPGYLSASDWNTFNNKLDASRSNYITNPDAATNIVGWNLYNNSGRLVPAYVVEQDITFTSVTAGNAGNGINVDYIFHASQSSATPLVTVVSPTHITIAWYNGPTLANNPTATQLKAAWDAVPGAVAIATCVISGTASDRQYITGSHLLGNGGDTAPVDGSSGTPSDLVLSRSTLTPLVGTSSFLLSKAAVNQIGTGVSTDFSIDSADKGNALQISFYYQGTAQTFGTASDVRIFLYDVTNNIMIPVTPKSTLTGPTNGLIYRYAAQFTASNSSVNYRLILHTATSNASAWDLEFDSVTINSVLDVTAATQVPKVVIPTQPITGAVTDRMAVMWQDGNSAWQPATMASGSDASTLWGFATNIVALTADIVVSGYLDGFSIGPFIGYNQYVDVTAGGISPLPSPFTDTGVYMGKGVASDAILVNPTPFTRLITSKGGLLGNAGANNGTGDQVLSVGANGNALIANSAASLGFNWAPAVVAGAGLTYTLATRTLALSNLAGDVTGAPQANAIAASTVTGKAITGYVSGAGTVAATDTILQAINKLNGNTALKSNTASPAFTGDVNSSTGNVLISTIGKGLQVKTGSNAKIGTAVLVGGTVTVANTSVTANSRIFLTSQTDGGTPGFLRVSAKVNATSFTILSSNALDTSTVAWMIVESIP